MFERWSQFLRRRPLLIVPLFLAAYGYGTIDVADFYRLSADPLALNTESSKQFLHFSPLPFFLGYPLTHAIGPRASYLAVIGGGVAFALWSLRRLVVQRYGALRDEALVMFFATPLLIVLTQYLGKSDPYVVAFALLLPTLTSPVAQAAVACLMVLSHFEMGLLILASSVVLGLVPVRTAAGGAMAGIAMVMGYHHAVLPAPPQSRAEIGRVLLRESLDAVATTPALHVLFSFGPFWLCVIAARMAGMRWRLMLAGTAVLACITLDFTRVFTLVGLPLTIVVVDRLVAMRAAARDVAAPAWMTALPIVAFVQAHLIGPYVYDSRLPEVVGRLIGYPLR